MPGWTGISGPGRVRPGRRTCRDGTAVGQAGACVRQPGEGAVGAEHLEGLEQRGADPATGHGHPDRGLGLAELATDRLGHLQGGRMQGARRPVGPECLVRGGGGGQDRRGVVVAGQCLLPRVGVDVGGVEEEEVDHARYLAEDGDALLDHRRHGPEGSLVERARGPRRAVALEPRPARLDEVLGCHGPDVLAVHVRELGDVEECRGVVDVGQREPVDHLVPGEHLGPVVGRAPPEEPQVVHEGVGKVALVAVGLDGHRVLALGQLLAGLVDQHRQMGEDGQWWRRLLRRADGAVGGPADAGQGVPHEDALGRGGKEVLAPDHVGDGHVDVVDHVGQHEQRCTVALDGHEVVHGLAGELDVPTDHVGDHHGPLVGRDEPQCPSLAPGQAQGAAVAVVARRQDPGCLVAGGDLVMGARTGVQETGIPERVDSLVVAAGAQRLAVGTLVCLHAEPVQGRQDAVDPLLPVALGVRVLDAQHEGAAGLTRDEPVEQRRPGAPHMEVAGRRGCEPHPRGVWCHPGLTRPRRW